MASQHGIQPATADRMEIKSSLATPAPLAPSAGTAMLTQQSAAISKEEPLGMRSEAVDVDGAYQQGTGNGE